MDKEEGKCDLVLEKEPGKGRVTQTGRRTPRRERRSPKRVRAQRGSL